MRPVEISLQRPFYMAMDFALSKIDVLQLLKQVLLSIRANVFGNANPNLKSKSKSPTGSRAASANDSVN